MAELPTYEELDLQKYTGKWFEIARFPNWFEARKATSPTAEYTLNSDGKSMTVVNTEYVFGVPFKARGTAWVVGGGRLAVQFALNNFGKPIKGLAADYYVVGVGAPGEDDKYSWSLVSEPTRKYAWILSRTYPMGEQNLTTALELAKYNGIDTSRFVYPVR